MKVKNVTLVTMGQTSFSASNLTLIRTLFNKTINPLTLKFLSREVTSLHEFRSWVCVFIKFGSDDKNYHGELASWFSQ